MTVALYILTEKYQDITNALVADFKSRVETDGGTFEADNCLKDNILALGGSMGNAESYNRIELFNDEKISITSSLKDVTDLSKTFTDYTQSFTIPASENNNIILKHWYENAVENGFDQRVRYNGYIEIDTVLFRKGKFQIESATIKDGKPKDYKLTFYGNLTSLTDEFGDNKLKDVLALNDYSYEYTASSVIDRVKGLADYDVMFPLISSDRFWQYDSSGGGGGAGSDNIANSGGAINTNELFPALKMPRVFEALQTQYSINFNSTFLQTEQFKRLFLLFKNKDTFEFKTEFKAVDLLGTNVSDDRFEINTDENYVSVISLLEGYEFDPSIRVLITPTITSAEWTLKAFADGLEYQSYNGIGISSATILSSYNEMADLLGQKLTFEISFNQATNYVVEVEAKYTEQVPTEPPTTYTIEKDTGTVSASLFLDLTLFAPDIKVTDFFSGFLKMFNLTCYSTDGINYTLETLDYWYESGRIKDISEYTERDFDISRVQTYKSINFEYQKSESLTNEAFYSNFERRYGDLKYNFNDDGSDYTIKLPFENILFQKFTGTNLAVGYFLKTDFQKYIPKPVILYKGDPEDVDFYMTTGSGHVGISSTPIFGAETYPNEVFSLNWGSENSVITGQNLTNSLYKQYYLNYLNNLYKKSSRLVNAKAKFPYSLLNSLQLNDRVVIRDKRYVIQKFTTDLLTFEVNLELLQDFRTVLPNNSFSVSIAPDAVSDIKFRIVPYDGLEITLLLDEQKIINSFKYEDDFLVLDVKENATGFSKIAYFETTNNDIIIIQQDA